MRECRSSGGELARAAAVALALAGAGAAMADPQPGWTLFAPTGSTTTYLIDMEGAVVHSWPSAFTPGHTVYLLDGGDLLRTCNDASAGGPSGAGAGGRIQRIAWDGTVEWDYVVAAASFRQHHDICPMPGGNVLAIVWERRTSAEAIAMGRNPARITQGELWPEAILEIEPQGVTGGEVVWEWHAWDHLVQNFDATKPNFGNPADHPHRINLNYPPTSGGADWLHFNGMDYHAGLDQIVVSSRTFNEIWVISHAPGDSGDLLYRWGNPLAYGLGASADQRLFGQHNPNWIREGLPGAGNMLVFNNGAGRPGTDFAAWDEIVTPVAMDGTYARAAGAAFGPAAAAATCATADGAQFFASNTSGTQRLANGNTLICLGPTGRFIELNAACGIEWEYTNPFTTPAVFRATRIGARDPRLEGLLWCAADFDGGGAATVGDIFAMLAAWFAGDAGTDFNGSGGQDIGDIFAFLAVWFAGC